MDPRTIVETEQGYKAAAELFLMRCRGMGLSARTLEWYGMILEGVRAFCEGLPDRPLPRHTLPRHLSAYLDSMRQRGIAPGSIKRVHVTLGTFFRFLAQEGVIRDNPLANIPVPKAPRVLVRPLSQDEMRAVLAQPKTRTFTGLRNWAMIVLALDSGLRASELLGIRMQDVAWGEGSIRVLGKGSKERLVYIGTMTKRALTSYLGRRGELPGVDYLFVDQFGRPVQRRWLEAIVNRYGTAAGVQGLHPHRLRHTFAVQFLRGGGGLPELSRILGHTTWEMTRRYLALTDRDAAEAHRKASPIDRIGPLPGERKKVLA